MHQVRSGALGLLDKPPQFRHGSRINRLFSSFQFPIDPTENENDSKTQHDVGHDLDGEKDLWIDVGHEHATLLSAVLQANSVDRLIS
jgi:hypothetical protein